MAISANAQYLQKSSMGATRSPKRVVTPLSPTAEQSAVSMPAHHSANKTTSLTPFATEDFGTGTASSLPTGWTAGIISGTGTWKWANTASTATYSIGAMVSASSANGWMIFDSDLLGGAGTGPAPSGWLESPRYNCSAHTSVRLSFSDYYRKFNDSCFVWVGTDSLFTGGTYTVYPVSLNNSIATNVSTANSATVHINISAAAASHAAVWIRYVYYGPTGGGYAWMIDDMNLSELNPHDVSLGGSFMYEGEANAYSGSIFNTPLVFVDSVAPVTLLSNQGNSPEPSVPVSAQIFNGTTSVYSQSITYTGGLAITGFDSIIQFPNYWPGAIGNYTCAFNAGLGTDGDLTNNIDTVTFAVTDTTWMENQGNTTGGYYLHRPASGSTTAISFMQGTRFDIGDAASMTDTLTGFGVCFNSGSTPTNAGATVSVQLYSIDQAATSWNFIASSVARPITAGDISSTTTLVWAPFVSDIATFGGWGQFILAPSKSYAAVVQMNNVSTTLIIESTSPPNASGYSGYFGQSDTSNNDGGQTFGGTPATGISAVPMVRLYFGHPHPVSVTNVNNNLTGVNAFPNPSSSSLNVTYNLATATDVTVTLTNTIGQVVATQNIANASSGNATFNTAALPAGVYAYTVSANGERSTGKVVVAH